MKKIAIYVAAAFMILLCDHRPSHAVPAPHDSQCLQCHVSHNMLGNQTNDLVCLTCHNPSGGAKAQALPFSPGDAANPFGSAAGMQSSHNWLGSDTNAQAGAQPPLNPDLALPQHAGKMSCAKCHNLHGPKESANNSAPFLRTLNDQDQMCLDCHRSRNTQSHVIGSHPVQVNYTAVAAAKPDAFYPRPRSSNPANPSAAMKLVKGQVSCSTCHGVHYTDSNSSTFDNRSSALLGRLKPSSGNLLRANMRGAAADDVNICTNCHKGMTAHNAGGENVQCADCHGGHVDAGDGSTPNVWLVRRFMTYSTYLGRVDTRSFGIPMLFQSTTRKNYLNADGTGVCQPCHKNPSPIPECSMPEKNCNTCHSHNNINGAFAPLTLECTSCHGQPPVQNYEGSPSGYATGYVGVNESLSAHQPHSDGGGYLYSCNDCHKGNFHGSGNFQQVFQNMAGTIAASFGATPGYDKTARSCSTTYCHSNGAPRGQATKYAAPVAFGDSKGSIIGKSFECVACHGGAVGGFNNLSTNAHFRHVSLDPASGMRYGCTVCHANVVSSNGAVSDRTKHVNGVKEISFSGPFTAGTTSDGANCSTNYCHSNGKGVYSSPSWTNKLSGSCGSCHATLPTLGSAVIATGAHFAHFSSSADSYGSMFSPTSAASCQKCHSYAGEFSAPHVNGSIEVSQGDYSPAGTGKCAPCHNQTVNWNGGGVTCQSCHTGPLSVMDGKTATDMSRSDTQGHGKAGIDCMGCHGRTKRHINGGSRLQPELTGSVNAECRFCHDSAAKVANPGFRNMSSHMTVRGGGQQMGCSVCHDAHGTNNLSQIRNVINGTPINYNDPITGFIDTNSNLGLCQVCHTATSHFRAGEAETDHPTKDCLVCHKHNQAGGAFKSKAVCDGCHGYPPAPRRSNTAISFGTMGNWSSARFEDYSGGGGAHLLAAHVPQSAKPSEGWVNCTMCHNAGVVDATPNHKMLVSPSTHLYDITVDVDPKYRFDNSFIVYTGAKLLDKPARNTTGSCFNISCHMSPSSRWSIER